MKVTRTDGESSKDLGLLTVAVVDFIKCKNFFFSIRTDRSLRASTIPFGELFPFCRQSVGITIGELSIAGLTKVKSDLFFKLKQLKQEINIYYNYSNLLKNFVP